MAEMEPVVVEVVEKPSDPAPPVLNDPRQICMKLFHNIAADSQEELLGSVTTSITDGPTVRTSARVISNKLRMDNAPPPPPEKKETQNESSTTNLPKTPSHSRVFQLKNLWTNHERNFFFEALKEHGREFELIANFINAKMKRRNLTDQEYKTKEAVRSFYFKMYSKYSKYVKFSDEVMRVPQELYTLINYSEMKRKLVTVTEKSMLKLQELIYRGFVTIRFKGKNYKIKTPSCPALRKLNQLEGNTPEEIMLPQRIDVVLSPVNTKSWGYVQTLAQNPRICLRSLPLQRRLASLLHTVQLKWQTKESRLYERYVTSNIQKHGAQKSGEDIVAQSHTDTAQLKSDEPLLKFMPPRDIVIHRPMVQLNELLSSVNICLNSFEERIGAKTRGETLESEKYLHIKDLLKYNSKRVRNDSASEKSAKIAKIEEAKDAKDSKEVSINAKTSDEVGISVIDHKSNDSLEMKIEEGTGEDILMTPPPPSEVEVKPAPVEVKPAPPTTTHKIKRKDQMMLNGHKTNREVYKPLIDEEELKKVRRGWTLKNVGDLTIGDLYLMFGSDSRLVLEYDCLIGEERKEDVKVEAEESRVRSQQIGGKLRSLLAMANLMESTTNPMLSNFFAGHACERNNGDGSGSDSTFKQPIGPRISFDTFNRSMLNAKSRNKLSQLRWIQQMRPRTFSHIIPGTSSNHVVRDLYETPKAKVEEPKPIQPESNKTEASDIKKRESDSDDDVKKIIEDKIQNMSGTMKVNNFMENSRSSISSLLDFFKPHANDVRPRTMSVDEESSFSLKLLEESAKNSSDDIDNYSLSSLWCRLDEADDNDQAF